LITAEFLPKKEQALRAREQLRGEAELEIADEKYKKEDGSFSMTWRSPSVRSLCSGKAV